MQKSFKQWFNLLPAIQLTINRFPLSFAASLVLVSCGMLLVHNKHNWQFEPEVSKLLFAAILIILAATSAKLWFERHQTRFATQSICYLVLIASLTSYAWFWLDFQLFASVILPIITLLLLLSFIVYINQKSSDEIIWYFNFQTVSALLFGFVAAIILGTGISASLASIAYLFDVKISGNWYGDTWILCWGFVFPNYVLANLSEQFEFEQQACEFPRGIRIITNYILMPLMALYFIILYAYVAKIALTQTLPKGNLAWMISIFGCLGIITKLLAYPMVETGTKLLKWFDRLYYPVLIVPVLTLFLAISIRINEYGITEPRYLVLLMAIWFSLCIIGALWLKQRFRLHYPLVILFVLGVFATISPWNAVTLATQSQLTRFQQTLERHGLWQNGQAMAATSALPLTVRRSITSSAEFFARSKTRLPEIEPWFAQLIQQNDKVSGFDHQKYFANAQTVMQLLNVKYTNRWDVTAQNHYVSYNQSLFDPNNQLDVADFEKIIEFTVRANKSEKNKEKSFNPVDVEVKMRNQQHLISIEFDGGHLFFKQQQQILAKFNIQQLVNEQLAQHQEDITEQNRPAFTFTIKNENWHYKLVLTNVSGYASNDNTNAEFDFTRIAGYWLIGH